MSWVSIAMPGGRALVDEDRHAQPQVLLRDLTVETGSIKAREAALQHLAPQLFHGFAGAAAQLGAEVGGFNSAVLGSDDVNDFVGAVFAIGAFGMGKLRKWQFRFAPHAWFKFRQCGAFLPVPHLLYAIMLQK